MTAALSAGQDVGPSVGQAVGRLEARRAAFGDLLDGLDPDVVHAAPAPGAWSLAQLAEHFLLIDGGLVPDGPPASAPVAATSRLRSRALQAVLALPLRIPAPPAARGVMPSAGARWPDVGARWAALRAGWRSLPTGPEVGPGHVAYRHPIFGPFLLPDALAFLEAHHRHHDRQIRRTLGKVESEKAARAATISAGQAMTG